MCTFDNDSKAKTKIKKNANLKKNCKISGNYTIEFIGAGVKTCVYLFISVIFYFYFLFIQLLFVTRFGRMKNIFSFLTVFLCKLKICIKKKSKLKKYFFILPNLVTNKN